MTAKKYKKEAQPVKRPRGRPPKNSIKVVEESVEKNNNQISIYTIYYTQ